MPCVIVLLTLLFSQFVDGADIIPWTTMLGRFRADHDHAPCAIYLGSAENRLPRLIAAGSIDCAGVPVVFVPATAQLQDPWTNRTVAGSKMQTLFAATAGTIVFLDEDGIPIPLLSIPQAMHGNDPELFAIYFRFVAAGHYRTMSISEYCRAIGHYDVLERAIARLKQGLSGRELTAHEALVPGINHLTGERIDPWSEPGVFTIYAAKADGRVFLAQIREILTLFGPLQPRITLIVPTGQEPNLGELPSGCQCVLAHAPAADIARQGPSPLLIFTAGGEHGPRGLRLAGFQPGSVLAKLLGVPIKDPGNGDHDVPYGEVDDDGDSSSTSTTTASVEVPAGAAPTPSASASQHATPIMAGGETR